MPGLRLKGHYLAMATLGFGLIVYRIVLGTRFFGEADGISDVPPFPLGCGTAGQRRPGAPRRRTTTSPGPLVLAAMVLAMNLVHSRVGRALRVDPRERGGGHTRWASTRPATSSPPSCSAPCSPASAGVFLTHYNGGIGPSEARS